jgi:single-stranded-DNA-specific exonuclease
MQIKNLDKAAKRIRKAVKNKEKIILCGDSDLDGSSSVIVLKETIKSLGGENPVVFFPDREKEGYGITEQALNNLKELSPALLITTDCGIGNFKEVKIAQNLGFTVIIVDHHKALDNKVPDAEIVVDPNQPGDEYPFKGLCATGLVFKLSEKMLGDKLTQNLRSNFLELVALATIADMMPQVDENKLFIDEGLQFLEISLRPGLKSFFESDLLKGYSFRESVAKIIPILNARDIEEGKPASYRLLTLPSVKEAKTLISYLIKKNEARRQKILQLVNNVEKNIKYNEDRIIFQGGKDFDFTTISAVASIICNKYKKATFIYKELDDVSQGTVRVPAGIDSVEWMSKCSAYVITYGGHAPASGFRIKNENLNKFKSCLIEN